MLCGFSLRRNRSTFSNAASIARPRWPATKGATCGVMTMFGRSWNGRWNGRPSFVSGYVHHVSRAARNLGRALRCSNSSSSTISLPRATFTRIASSLMRARKPRSTRPWVARVSGSARKTASASGRYRGRSSIVPTASGTSFGGGARATPTTCMSKALQRRAISDPIPPKPRMRAVEPASPLFSTVWLKIPRRISSVRATTSFAAARRSAIACSATEMLYAPALLHTMADGGNRSNRKWSTPATSDWIIRTFRAFSRKSSGNSRGTAVDTKPSAVAPACSRFSGGKSSRITGSNAPVFFLARAARRSASIGTMNRTRAMWATHRAGGLGPFDGAPRSAFRVAARVAFDAAFLEHEGLAALRALRIQAFPQQLRGVAALLLHLDVRLDGAAELVVRLHRRLDAGLLHADVPLDRLRDRVRDRVDALPMVDRDPRAPDALELVDDLVDRDAGPQAERDEARDAFRERRGVAAAAANLREHLEQAFLVLVDGHVQRAVSGQDLLRSAGDDVRTGAWPDDCRLGRHRNMDLFRLLGLRDADVEDLVLARAVAVHGGAFAMEGGRAP